MQDARIYYPYAIDAVSSIGGSSAILDDVMDSCTTYMWILTGLYEMSLLIIYKMIKLGNIRLLCSDVI